MLEQFTKEQFVALQGTVFGMVLGDGTSLEVTLTAVDDVVPPGSVGGWGHDSEVIRNQPFALVFRAPHEPALWQGIYVLTHEKLGELPGIFLVPVAQDGNGRYYEAVFN